MRENSARPASSASPGAARQPGRICPPDYRTDPADLARTPDFAAATIYAVGGLYGNAFALDAIEALAAAEASPVTLVFNGDAHWFDAEPSILGTLDARLARYRAIAGNVECELVREHDAGAGCGCAYPPEVSDDVVARSNTILARLRKAVEHCPSVRARLKVLAKTLVADVGGMRVGIVHGDPTSLAGWGFAAEALDDPASHAWLDDIRRASRINIFASTHTCAAVMREVALPSGRLIVANNGAAGMGNFDGDPRGLITRISTMPNPHATLYGLRCGPVHVDAVPVAFDVEAFARAFDRIWQPGSAAAISYRKRIIGQSAGGASRPAILAAGPHRRRRHPRASGAGPATAPTRSACQTK